MHELNLKLLQDLQALADTGSLYKAAERRHITHPAFGRRIRALEEALAHITRHQGVWSATGSEILQAWKAAQPT